MFYKASGIYLRRVSSRCITKMTFKFTFKTSFQYLQDILARCLVCLNKTFLEHLIDVFLSTSPSRKASTCSKLATQTQNQGEKTIYV